MVEMCGLPAAPSSVHGWPWTFERPEDAGVLGQADVWPRITVVVPSYNQGQFIEETIRSVLLQKYPNLEFFVMDGGSTDNTVEILEKYDPWIAHWESQPDRGQSHAINKGWSRSTGAIVAWLNSDDTYTPGALSSVGKAFVGAPDCASISGHTRFEPLSGGTIATKAPQPFDPAHYLRGGLNPGQPSVFLAKSTYAAVGPVDESLRLSLDRDYWIRIGLKLPMATHIRIQQDLAVAKVWEGNNATLWSGNIANLDIREIHEEHLAILEKTFRSPELTEALRASRRSAYAIEMTKYAINCSLSGQRRNAAKYAFMSVFRSPLIVRRRSFWGLLRSIVRRER